MQKGFMLIGISFAFLANVLGAFGTHVLENRVETGLLNAFKTGVQYHFYHSLALLIVAILMFNIRNRWLVGAGLGFILGCILFSGSLYVLTLTGIKEMGMFTPLGGLSFLIGWILFFISILKTQLNPVVV